MGCRSSQVSQTGKLERTITPSTAKLLKALGDDAPCPVKNQLSTIFEAPTMSTSFDLSTASLDVVLLGPCATKVAESSAKMNATRHSWLVSPRMESFLNDSDLVGMPQNAPKRVRIRGASRGRDADLKHVEDEPIVQRESRLSTSGSASISSSFCSRSWLSSQSVVRKSTSEDSTSSGSKYAKIAIGITQKFRCFVQIGEVHVTLRLWPVEGLGTQMPTFSIEKCGHIAYLGLMPIDDGDPDSAWSELSQRLDEIRYFSKVYSGSETKLGCVPLLTNGRSEQECSSDATQPERLNHFAVQCAKKGLLDLTHGGGPICLADTACLFEVIVHRVAKWLLENS